MAIYEDAAKQNQPQTIDNENVAPSTFPHTPCPMHYLLMHHHVVGGFYRQEQSPKRWRWGSRISGQLIRSQAVTARDDKCK